MTGNTKISIIFIHHSSNDYKDYVGMNCLIRLWKVIQKNPEIEIIGVNNGERNEKQMQVLCAFYIKNDINSLGRARNKGFDASSGGYVCFMDDDIYTELPFWNDCAELLEKYPDLKLIASPIYTATHRIIYRDGHAFSKRSGSNCLFMKRESFLDIGRFTETEGRAADGVEFCNRQIKKGYAMILTRPSLARDVGMAHQK